ncbi:unnamed protein product [Prunus armeniaca]|nr:hypothetical protein GBA52_007905 [Prunus armeniaca]
MKLKFDESVCNDTAGTGYVIMNCDGHMVLAGAKNIGHVSITIAECLALRDGYTLPKGWCKVLIGDSKVVIDCVNHLTASPWSIKLLIQDIMLLCSLCDDVACKHV